MTSKIKVNILADGADNSIITSDGAGSFTASSGLASSVQSVGGIQNTPAFYAYLSSNISDFTANQYNTIVFQTELMDTASCYDTSTGVFTPNVAGKYFCFAQAKMGNFGDGAGNKYMTLAFFWGGTSTQAGQTNIEANGETTVSVSNIINFNGTTDSLRVRGYQNDGAGTRFVVGGSGSGTGVGSYTYFGAYRIIGA